MMNTKISAGKITSDKKTHTHTVTCFLCACQQKLTGGNQATIGKEFRQLWGWRKMGSVGKQAWHCKECAEKVAHKNKEERAATKKPREEVVKEAYERYAERLDRIAALNGFKTWRKFETRIAKRPGKYLIMRLEGPAQESREQAMEKLRGVVIAWMLQIETENRKP